MPTNDHVISKLNDLIQLDYDAIEAYQAAVARLEDAGSRQQLTEFCADHQRHTANLAARVVALAGEPAQGPDLKRYLTKGKVVIAGTLGGDHAVLVAMLANEEVTNKRYEVALEADGMDPTTRSTVEANLADERRHRAWISEKAAATRDRHS